MKSDDCNAKQPLKHSGLLLSAAVLIFLLMELPVRFWLQPDPWLLEAQYWYFYQPLRLTTEVVLVILLLVAVRLIYPTILTLQRSQTKAKLDIIKF